MATQSQVASTVPDYIHVIYKVAKKLRLTKLTVAKAALLCHIFYTKTSEDTYDMKVIAAAAVSFVVRLNQEIVNKPTKIGVLYEVLNGSTVPEDSDSSLETFEKNMLLCELFLFKMCDGNTSHKVALEFLDPFLKSIRIWDHMEEKWRLICANSAKLALEMYNCVECLKFMPEVLAAAAVCISLDLFGYAENHLTLCQRFCPFLKIKELDDITEYLWKNEEFTLNEDEADENEAGTQMCDKFEVLELIEAND